MTNTKRLVLIFALGLFTTPINAQAVKGLKYVPQAAKGTKFIPRVINPKLPLPSQLNVSAISNVVSGTAVQRAVERAASRQVRHTRLTQSLGTQLLAEPTLDRSLAQRLRLLDKLSKQLTALEEYANKHNGKLPWVPGISQQILADQTATRKYVKFIEKKLGLPAAPFPGQYNYNEQQILMIQVHQHIQQIAITEDLAKRYEILCQRNAAQLKEEAFLQKDKEELFLDDAFHQKYPGPYRTLDAINASLRQRTEQERDWKAEVAERDQRTESAAKFDKITDENATKAAYRAETLLFQPAQEATEDFVEQLLNFYEKMDPFGKNTFDNNLVFNSPAQWADKLEKFIDKYHRAPIYPAEITSQQLLDELRLAKAINGLLNRLPKDNPDVQRIEQLLTDVNEGH